MDIVGAKSAGVEGVISKMRKGSVTVLDEILRDFWKSVDVVGFEVAGSVKVEYNDHVVQK